MRLPSKKTETETLIAVLSYPTRELQAESLKITTQSLHERIKRYKIKELIAEHNANYAENAASQIFKMLPKAVKALEQNLDSSDERIKLDTSKEVLKRTLGDQTSGSPLVQNNIQIVTGSKEKYNL